MSFTSNSKSAQVCGCDPGCGPEGYKCERHWLENRDSQVSVGVITAPTGVVSLPQVVNLTDVKPVSPGVGSPEWRKQRPLWSGVLRYFPDALLEVANVSWVGNEQHNPGEALHWNRAKSQDEGDACARHLVAAGTRDTDGTRHSAKAAWRILALLQKEIEAENV